MNRKQRRAAAKNAPKPKKKPIYANLTREQRKEALFKPATSPLPSISPKLCNTILKIENIWRKRILGIP